MDHGHRPELPGVTLIIVEIETPTARNERRIKELFAGIVASRTPTTKHTPKVS